MGGGGKQREEEGRKEWNSQLDPGESNSVAHGASNHSIHINFLMPFPSSPLSFVHTRARTRRSSQAVVYIRLSIRNQL